MSQMSFITCVKGRLEVGIYSLELSMQEDFRVNLSHGECCPYFSHKEDMVCDPSGHITANRMLRPYLIMSTITTCVTGLRLKFIIIICNGHGPNNTTFDS